MLVFCCAVKVFIFSRFLMAIFFNYYTLFEGLGQDCFLRIYHRGTYSQRSKLAPFLRALQISRYPHDHSRFVCYRQSFFAKLHKSHKSCKAHKPRVFRGFVVSWFCGIRTAASVLRKASMGSDETLLPRSSPSRSARRALRFRRTSPHHESF